MLFCTVLYPLLYTLLEHLSSVRADQKYVGVSGVQMQLLEHLLCEGTVPTASQFTLTKSSQL